MSAPGGNIVLQTALQEPDNESSGCCDTYQVPLGDDIVQCDLPISDVANPT